METKKYTAIIWRESVYKNDFKCWCGYKLFDPKKPTLSKALWEEDGLLSCPKCGLLVGKTHEIEDIKDMPALMGSWPEYEKRKAN